MLLFKNEELNDYDFILYHLFVKNSNYREYFSQIMREGKRMTIFDNSAYEFYRDGGEFDQEEFCKIVEEFNPTYFIVPDVLMDIKATLSNFREWKTVLPGRKRMVVPQGKSFKEWMICYEEMLADGDFDYIGIPFHNDFFWDLGMAYFSNVSVGFKSKIDSTDMIYAFGRHWLLQYLKFNNLIDPSKKYHLLGSHAPIELRWLKQKKSTDFNWINSMDTSYPVTKGIVMKDIVDGPKETISIDDFFDMSLSSDQLNKIIYNIQQFHGYKN